MADKDRGYIKLHRKIQDSMIWNSDEPFDYRSAWIDILLSVSHDNFEQIVNRQTIYLSEGEMLVSLNFLKKRWNWGSLGMVSRFLDTVESSGMLTRRKLGKCGTVIKVTNYNKYQNSLKDDARNGKRNENGKETESTQQDKRKVDGKKTIHTNTLINNTQKEKGSQASQDPSLFDSRGNRYE